MNITELLVTGYDGNEPIFVVSLAPDRATTLLTAADREGDTAVDSIAEQPTGVFAPVRELLETLALAPAQM